MPPTKKYESSVNSVIVKFIQPYLRILVDLSEHGVGKRFHDWAIFDGTDEFGDPSAVIDNSPPESGSDMLLKEGSVTCNILRQPAVIKRAWRESMVL
jgi:hypothetical protein